MATRENASGADDQQERPVGEDSLLESSETVRQIPNANSEKIQSELHGDMQRVAEMSTPLHRFKLEA